MPDRATGINPAMLRWAREQAGYPTVAPVASRLQRPAAVIEAWESGAEFPTWRQLERLALELYHRPTALFFFPEPPEEPAPAAEFRRLPETALNDLEPDTWLAVRQARARLLDLAELAQFDDSAERQILRDLGAAAAPNRAAELAGKVRDYLGVDLDAQMGWPSVDAALEHWREAVQAAGVWVFKRSFKQQDVAGFCLDDARHPLLYLNNGQPKTRQIFTLFHELAHLLFEFNHLERTNVEHYVAAMSGHDREVEIACNGFAGELLAPSEHFREYAGPALSGGVTDAALAKLAHSYRVSREVILRKARNENWISDRAYGEWVSEWNQANIENSGRGGGGSYYANQGTYLGQKYTGLAFRGYYLGAYDIDQLADYLEVKESSVPGLEDWLSRKTAA